MDVSSATISLTADESTAVRTALRSYLSDLRAEIVDTDNPGYRRDLRSERAALESAVGKLDDASRGPDPVTLTASRTVRVVDMWWSPEEH